MSRSNQRFHELLDSVLDGSCSDDERQEFADLVEGDRGLAPEIVEQLRTHSLLQWQCDHPQILVPDFPIPAIEAQLAGRIFSTVRSSVVSHRRGLMAAAALLIGCGVFAWQYFQQSSSGNDSRLAVAEIVKDDLVTWADNTTALKGRGQIVAGRLEMKSGSLTLRFRSGATLTATGAVSMLIESDMLVRLEKGQATAHVPQWARGFTVQTPDAKIVDLGTSFGVDARASGLTDIVVFEGEVDVTPASGGATLPTRLTQGEAARVDNQGSIGRIVEVHRDHWGEKWSTNVLTPGRSVFKSIRDNIKPNDSAKYYEITPRAMADDVKAYVDRPHQWNGLTSVGLPKFLSGADYVKTFNDYKYRPELQIDIELSRPAEVFIFFDDRVPTPEWLSDQFEKLDVKIGLDEGPWPEIDPIDPSLSTAIGAGRSIDNVFSIWRRRCEIPETLTLGAMGDTAGARAIYGIAAKPLE